MDLWKLDRSFEILDLEGGFFIARFRSKEDYVRLLEGDPWIVMGHYLSISKWRPSFKPNVEEIFPPWFGHVCLICC